MAMTRNQPTVIKVGLGKAAAFWSQGSGSNELIRIEILQVLAKKLNLFKIYIYKLANSPSMHSQKWNFFKKYIRKLANSPSMHSQAHTILRNSLF